ncbi:MAG: hypothetical protein ABIS51_11410 [Sphingomonas sp.]
MTTVLLGNLEGRMCGHLMAALALFMTRGERGCSISNGDMSDWHFAAGVFEQLAITVRAPGESFASFNMDAVEIPDYLAATMAPGDPRVAKVIEAFVAIASSYGVETVSDEREWFEPPARYLTAMKWLARFGYVERHQAMFRWTDLIYPAMRATYAWTAEGESLATIRREEESSEVEAICRTMPDTLRQNILAGRIGLLDLVKILALGWKDGAWQQYRADDSFEVTGQIAVARKVIDRLQTSACA